MLRCDLIIRDATIFDGTGAPRRKADIAVTNDRITGVGDLGSASADREIIATGKAVAPGFIDAHTHDDRAVLCGPECMLCKSSQGVTTVVVGNCGISLSPVRMRTRPIPPLDLLGDESWWTFGSFAEYAERLARQPSTVNTVALIGHMSLRVEAMRGDTQRAATDKEAERMRARLTEALHQGAAGFSTGLYYPPSMNAPTEEVIAIAQALRETGGLYVTHMRDEADHVLESIEETLKIGRNSNAPVVISHHKCAMPENYGRSTETLPRIETAAQRQKVAFDVYPYHAGSTVLMPARLRPDVPVQITWSVPHPELAGQMLDDIAKEWNTTPKEAAEKLLPAGAIFFQMDEQDVQRILKHDLSMIGSDGLPHELLSPPAPLGHLPARARPLCARPRPLQHGASGPQDDRPHRRGVRPEGPRRHPRRRLRRPRAVRSRHRPRRGRLPITDPSRRRHSGGLGQRPIHLHREPRRHRFPSRPSDTSRVGSREAAGRSA